MNKPITVTETCLCSVLKVLELPKEYVEGLKKDKERVIKMLKAANWKLRLYRSWEKQRPLKIRMPIPSLEWLDAEGLEEADE